MFCSVEIEVNSSCNRKCWYCPNSIHKRIEQGEMDITLFKKLMEQLQSINYAGRISYHFYSEPLLCSNLEYFISLTKKYIPKANLVLFSNGDYLSEKRIVDLKIAGINEFVLTQHAGGSNIFFDNIMNNLPQNIRKRIDFYNYDKIKDSLSNRGGIVPAGKENIYCNDPCERPGKVVVVTLLGNVIPCCEDYFQADVMGNIQKEHIMDIWNSQKYKEFRKNLLHGNRSCSQVCYKCNHESKAWDYGIITQGK